MSLQPVVVAYPCGPPKMPMEIHPAFMEAHGSCRWSEDEEGNWWTECGEGFFFEAGGPIENRAQWCLYCGHKIEPVEFVEPNTEAACDEGVKR